MTDEDVKMIADKMAERDGWSMPFVLYLHRAKNVLNALKSLGYKEIR